MEVFEDADVVVRECQGVVAVVAGVVVVGAVVVVFASTVVVVVAVGSPLQVALVLPPVVGEHPLLPLTVGVSAVFQLSECLF